MDITASHPHPTLKAFDRFSEPISVGSTVEWNDGTQGVVLDLMSMTEGTTLQVLWEDGAREYVAPSTVQLA